MAHRRKLIAGNWKMNGLKAAIGELRAIAGAASGLSEAVDIAICPPALIASQAAEVLAGSGVALGGQDCHAHMAGAHTGDLSAEMWADAGARYVIVGHSERRSDHHETDEQVRNKASAVMRAGLVPIVCLGETLEQRDAGETLAVIREQLSGSLPKQGGDGRLVVAYEPVWAIGTGRTPTSEQVNQAHSALRSALREALGQGAAEAVQILYGGSVKPDNARELLHIADVDGALVGGASLKASDFMAIVRAAV